MHLVPPTRADTILVDNADLQIGSTPKPGKGGILYIMYSGLELGPLYCVYMYVVCNMYEHA